MYVNGYRSDVDVVELEDGWMAVRTAAVEDQASSCQLVMLLVERLQEHFLPYVEQTCAAVTPLVSSVHEDVRSFAMVCLPELVRATGKGTIDRLPLCALARHCIGCLIRAVEKEGSMLLIMTALQAMKLTITYSCMDWNSLSSIQSGIEPLTE